MIDAHVHCWDTAVFDYDGSTCSPACRSGDCWRITRPPARGRCRRSSSWRQVRGRKGRPRRCGSPSAASAGRHRRSPASSRRYRWSEAATSSPSSRTCSRRYRSCAAYGATWRRCHHVPHVTCRSVPASQQSGGAVCRSISARPARRWTMRSNWPRRCPRCGSSWTTSANRRAAPNMACGRRGVRQ